MTARRERHLVDPCPGQAVRIPRHPHISKERPMAMTSPTADRLERLGIELSRPVSPVANYVPAVKSGKLVFISGQIALGESGEIASRHRGKLGAEVSHQNGRDAARQCAINVLSQLNAEIGGIERVVRCVRLTGYVNCTPDFQSLPQIMNGASDLMTEVFCGSGRHARTTVGVAQLPLDSAVEIEAIFEIS